jgi:transposase InsO family protein
MTKLRFVCYTLTVTDIATGWAMHYALENKAHKWVQPALEHLRLTAIFPFFAVHSDSGSEFLDSALYAWAKEHHILFTKGRTGKKNDNFHVEQKNNASVRHIVGHCRLASGL